MRPFFFATDRPTDRPHQDDVQQPPVPPPSLRIPEQVTDADIEEARGALPMPTAPAAAAESGDTEMTPAPAGAPPTTQAAAGSALTLDAFSRMLDAMPSVQNQNPAALAAARRAVLTEPTVPDLLRSSELGDALQTPNVQRALPALFEHLPEADRNAEAVAELMRCPQLLTQAASLSRALSSGQGAGLLRSLGLDEADGDSIGMNALLEALKKAQEKK